jgi:integrase
VIATGLSRTLINSRIARIKRLFSYGVENELVRVEVYQALAQVKGLSAGRSKARETAPITPVAESLVLDTMEHLAPVIRDMVALQLATGMRSGELVTMRTGDIDMTGPVWLYRPRKHKNKHRGKARLIALGERSQQLVKKFLRLDREAFLFSPRENLRLWNEEKRARRKTRVQPSQLDRSKSKPKKEAGERYTRHSYAQAITRACDKHGLPHWHPHQLRHSAALKIKQTMSLESARAYLGHSSVDMSEHYAGLDEKLACEVAAKIG